MDNQESVAADQSQKVDRVDALLAGLASAEFSKKLEEYKVKLDGEIYTIRALDANARETYLDFQAGKAKFDNKGQYTGMKSVKGFETKLVSLGLFDSNNNPVSQEGLLTWNGSTVGKIAAIIARISGLDEKAEAAAKNA